MLYFQSQVLKSVIDLIYIYVHFLQNYQAMNKTISQLQTDTIQASKANPQSPTNSPKHAKKPKIQKKYSAYSQLSDINKLWRQSSLSLTRDHSPSHKIPNSIRFKPLKHYEKSNKQFLTLELRENMNSDRSINFAKSLRPEHWVKGLGQLGPSPASYKCQRFMQDSHYKSNQMKEAYKKSPLVAFYQQRKARGSIKGQSFTKFQNHHKTYLQHTKNRLYQPQSIEGQPGPGQYTHSWINKTKSKNYSIRPTLKRFNQHTDLNPGPGTYANLHEKLTSFSRSSVKGTISRIKRDYLAKFEDFPGPNQYAIHRFLQQYTE